MDGNWATEGSSKSPPEPKSPHVDVILRTIKKESMSPGYSSDEEPQPPSANTNGSLAELTEMLAQGLQASHYKRLKPFSGSSPVPQGEESFEVWKEHLLQCLQEWTCSEETKRQRITESLRSPASELIRLHRNLHPDTTARDLVRVLSGHYEPYHDHVQMVIDFRMSRQQEKEKVSDFINRLQLSLSRLVYHQAILPEDVDGLRTSQLTRGLWPQHPLTPILKMRLIDTDMSVYDLLMLVKKYEAELQFSSPRKVGRDKPTPQERELLCAPEASGGAPLPSSSTRTARSCPNCGNLGHTALHCRNTIESTVQSVTCDAAPGSRKSSKRKAKQSFVGPKAIITVLVDGNSTPALFDTGSQVTIIYRSFYRQHLSTIPLQPLEDIELWGLNPSSYPVDGRMQVEIAIPGLSEKGSPRMTVTALVCPDPGDQRAAPVILGTNCASVYSAFQAFIKELPSKKNELRLVDCLGSGPEAVPTLSACPITLGSPGDSVVPPDKMSSRQKQDPEVGPLYRAVLAKDRDLLKKTLPSKCSHYLRDWDKFTFKEGVLFRVVQYHDHPDSCQLVLPSCYRRMVFRNLHDCHGHLGPEKTYGLIVDRFYWLNMKEDVIGWCRRCLRCLQRKTLPTHAAPLEHLKSTEPMDLVCIDYLCTDPDAAVINANNERRYDLHVRAGVLSAGDRVLLRNMSV